MNKKSNIINSYYTLEIIMSSKYRKSLSYSLSARHIYILLKATKVLSLSLVLLS